MYCGEQHSNEETGVWVTAVRNSRAPYSIQPQELPLFKHTTHHQTLHNVNSAKDQGGRQSDSLNRPSECGTRNAATVGTTVYI